jgi:hypothetical protein
LSECPARGCEGVIWFRLPVDADRLNWDVRTLAAVMRGKVPEARLHMCIEWSSSEEGLVEIVAENKGDREAVLPTRIRAYWTQDARALAMDSVGNYTLTTNTSPGEAVWSQTETSRSRMIRPGRRARVGWIKFFHETALQIEVSDAFSNK